MPKITKLCLYTCRENYECGFFFPGMVYNYCNIAALPDAAAVIGFHSHSQHIGMPGTQA